MSVDGKATRCRYRPDGLRYLRESADGKQREQLWDGQEMVAEANGNGVFERYLRGIGLLAREQDGSRQYYLHNGHGDVVERTDQKGTALHRYRYDAFGNEENPVGLDPNPWRYCGEYYDAETGTYYLRARYYAPGLGRFLSEDRVREATYQLPNQQKVLDPLSLNLYTYCKNNPILLTDPSGNYPSEYDIKKYVFKEYFRRYSEYFEGSIKSLQKNIKKFYADVWNNLKQIPNSKLVQYIQKYILGVGHITERINEADYTLKGLALILQAEFGTYASKKLESREMDPLLMINFHQSMDTERQSSVSFDLRIMDRLGASISSGWDNLSISASIPFFNGQSIELGMGVDISKLSVFSEWSVTQAVDSHTDNTSFGRLYFGPVLPFFSYILTSQSYNYSFPAYAY